MNYLEIFEDIVEIMNYDYSGYLDKKKYGNPDKFRSSITNDISKALMTPVRFSSIVNEFLSDYKDPHLIFTLTGKERQKSYDIGFNVRRYEDKLYITSITQEGRLALGDSILSIDGYTIPQLADMHRNQIEVYGPGIEREKWEPIIKKYKTITVCNSKGEIYELDLKNYEPIQYYPNYSFKLLEDNIGLITLTDFENTESINKILMENETIINECNKLIIDVRKNRGGSDDAYFKLLDFIFDKEININDFFGSPMQLNMTERNYRLRMNDIKTYLENIEDEDSKVLLNTFINILEENRGQGLVSVKLSMPDMIIHGKPKPEKIVVLTDVFCGSSGDSFVEVAKMSPKVTVIGRHTAGVTDYSNLAVQRYDDRYIFMYATSRNINIDKGEGINMKGHAPHIYVPWTVEHISKDIDLEYAINLDKEMEEN